MASSTLHSIYRTAEKQMVPCMYTTDDRSGPGGEFEAKNFFRVFSLGHVLRQDGPVKVFTRVKVFKGTADVDGESSVFAIKRVRKFMIKTSKREGLFREVEVLRELQHPNILKIHQFYRHDPAYYYMVLEFLTGSELFDYIGNKERYTEADARDLCRALVDATSYLHEKGIVHRDLNSRTIVVSVNKSSTSTTDSVVGDGFQLKIADFGKACSLRKGPIETLVETPGYYLAPEVILGHPHFTSVDMWSVGLIAFILLSGKHPFFKRNDMGRMFLRVAAGEWEFKPEDWAKVSDDAKAFVRSLLVVDVEARMTAAAAKIHPWLLGTTSRPPAPSLEPNLEELKLFNMKRKLKLAVETIIIGRRLISQASGFSRDYVLGKELGKGNFGVVFEATAAAGEGDLPRSVDTEDVVPGESRDAPRCYAVKRIEKKGMDDRAKQEVLQEVGIMRQLNHEHVVSIYDFYKDDPKYFYMVLELMKGGELLHCIQRKECYDEAEARDVCAILLDALEYIHEQDIVHCDLKPENLLLASPDDDTSIRIADFGLAGSVRNGLLIEGCGTPSYMAPEIWRGKPFGKAVDMWSVGVILYVLLAGYLPFRHVNERLLRGMIKGGHFKFHRKYWSYVSDEAKDLIRKLLVVDPNERLSATAARRHPWLSLPRTSLSSRSLKGSLEMLQVFSAKQKLRRVVRTVMFMNRVQPGSLGGEKVDAPCH